LGVLKKVSRNGKKLQRKSSADQVPNFAEGPENNWRVPKKMVVQPEVICGSTHFKT
jgi:hypothetical protein